MATAKRPRRRTQFDQLASMAATIETQATSIDKLIAALLGKSDITRNITDPPATAEHAPSRRVYLTPRELEVARLIVDGLTTPQIAVRLTLEIATVKTHRRGISRKVGTSSKAGLIAKRGEWDIAT